MQSNSLQNNPDSIILVYRFITVDVEIIYKENQEIAIFVNTETGTSYITNGEQSEVIQSLKRLSLNFPSLIPSLPQWARKLISNS